MTDVVPADLIRLLELPLYGALGTIRPDGSVQVNPMWFELDGDTIKFTHTNKRAKFRNLQQNPAMSLMVLDPDSPFHYLEVRGRLVEDDPRPHRRVLRAAGPALRRPRPAAALRQPRPGHPRDEHREEHRAVTGPSAARRS